MSSLLSLLPPYEGLLPKWLLFISVISLGNSIQAYSTLRFTQRVYSGSLLPPSAEVQSKSPVTALSARTFGTWTALSSIVRLYAAYHIRDAAIYQITIWTFLLALGHFGSEWLAFGTARWGPGLAGPIIVSTVSLVWMIYTWDSYVI